MKITITADLHLKTNKEYNGHFNALKNILHQLLEEVIRESFLMFNFYNNEGSDLSKVSLFNDPEYIGIVERVKKEIDLLQENQRYAKIKKDQILEKALDIILGT